MKWRCKLDFHPQALFGWSINICTKIFWGFRFELLMLVCSLPTKSRKRLACNALVIFATHSGLVHGSLKAAIHFQSWSHDYMMHDQLLWDTTDHDVIMMTLSGLGWKNNALLIMVISHSNWSCIMSMMSLLIMVISHSNWSCIMSMMSLLIMVISHSNWSCIMSMMSLLSLSHG